MNPVTSHNEGRIDLGRNTLNSLKGKGGDVDEDLTVTAVQGSDVTRGVNCGL
jgi:hypothetical protein